MSKQFGVEINPAPVVGQAVAGVTLVTKISETVTGLEKMRAVYSKRRHEEFGKQIKPWEKGEESYDTLRAEDKTEQAISRAIKTLERMKDYASAFDAMKPEALAEKVTKDEAEKVEA